MVLLRIERNKFSLSLCLFGGAPLQFVYVFVEEGSGGG